MLTLYYQHEYRKDIQEKPAHSALIHVIDDVILLSLKNWPFSFDCQWFLSCFKDKVFESVLCFAL